MRLVPILALTLLPAAVRAQPVEEAPLPDRPQIQVQGRILRVAAGFGQGMPALEVASDGRTWKVWLGSMRYLIQNNFNPRAGQRIVIRALRRSEDSDELWAVVITLPDSRQTLRLRDNLGRPLWRRGWARRAGPKSF
jgi:hypothetical protein